MANDGLYYGLCIPIRLIVLPGLALWATSYRKYKSTARLAVAALFATMALGFVVAPYIRNRPGVYWSRGTNAIVFASVAALIAIPENPPHGLASGILFSSTVYSLFFRTCKYV
jgi:hypothetical protein